MFTYRAVDGADQSAVIRVVIDVDPKATPPPRRADAHPVAGACRDAGPDPKPDKTDAPARSHA